MSLTISGSFASNQSFSVADLHSAQQPPAKPTVGQQMHQLASSGQSDQQIATALGLPLAEVQSSLDGTVGTSAAVVALAGRLSVKA